MFTIKNEAFVNAPPRAVFELITDASRLPEWCTELSHPRPDDVYPEAGGKLEFVFKVAGIGMKSSQTSVIHEADRAFVVRAETIGASTTGTWSFVEEGEGTRMTLEYTYEIPGGRVAEVITEKLFAESMRKSQKAWLGNIKRLVE